MDFPFHQESYTAENRVHAEDIERLQEAWGPQHRNDSDFKQARNGDHLLELFECTLCVFRTLKRREPTQCNPQDVILKDASAEPLLDAFWSRSSGTVKGY